MQIRYARRMAGIKASEIRELLKITQQPEIISFAGGLPAPELFPVEEIKEVSRLVLEESGARALQYTTTEGYAPLRAWIAERMNSHLQTNFSCDNILITHGSQQGLDFTGKVFLDRDDIVICESPTYLAAISAFRSYECQFIEAPTDNDGMIIPELEKLLKEHNNVKLIYAITNFQNPTGRTWSLERRQRLAAVSAAHGVILLEDNPYGELRFSGEFLPSVKAFDQTGNVLCLGSFSKIFCPGYRIGWIAGEKEIIDRYVLVKQGADLQCNTLAQMEIAKYLELYDIDLHITKIRDVYRRRRDLCIRTMEQEFPDSVVFTRPEGGLFAWAELPETVNARDVFLKSLEKKVAFVPGGSFFPNGGRENTLRINFSNMPEERIVEGIGLLGGVLRKFIG